MKRMCRNLQARLAEDGPTALHGDPKAQRHLEECDDCFSVLESLEQLEAALADLPLIDAPDTAVERLLTRPELLQPGTAADGGSPRGLWHWLSTVGGRWPQPFVLRTAGSLAAVLLVVLLASWFGSFGPVARQGSPEASWDEGAAVRMDQSALPELEKPQDAAGTLDAKEGEVEDEIADEMKSQVEVDIPAEELKGLRALGYLGGVPRKHDEEALGEGESEPEMLAPTVDKDQSARTLEEMRSDDQAAEPLWMGMETEITFRGGSPKIESDAVGPFDDRGEGAEEVRQRLRERLQRLPRGETLEEDTRQDASTDGKREEAAASKASPAQADGDALAEAFLAERSRVEGLRFQPAEGYWANTYVPGDPALRHVQASLLRRDRTALEAFGDASLALHDAARQPAQSFDPPETAALAVYLHADRAAILGRERLMLQVGLQASDRRGGRRPAMNLALVLDLRGEIPTTTATTLRALVSAFAQARDLGDSFRLWVVGRPGGEVVGPAAFHHGPVVVTVERLLNGTAAEGETLDLTEALLAAAEAVGRENDPTSPLGSSAVILITDQPLGAQAPTLARLAHRSALAGVTVSVVGVGERVDLAELEGLALAGQGNRRLLHEPAAATAVVERELAAVGRAVARAVRLRIRLAPGVELIDVLGSHRLDVAAAERVRQTEQSLDRRLSKNLGIAADRGDEEDGIQIILPSFYAGDSHVVLLDVVASGAGPIADVQARYKDLVYFENGVSRAHLDLAQGVQPAGALERGVLKNLLAYDARGAFDDAGRLLQAGDVAGARERLETFRRLLLGMGRALPDLAKDPDLERDMAILGEYVGLLEAGAANEDATRSHLAESLRFSGRLKVLPRPPTAGDS